MSVMKVHKGAPVKVTFLFDKSNNWLVDFINVDEIATRFPEYDFSQSYTPIDVKDQDLVFILGYTKILKPEFLMANDLCLVVHESDLPKGKGFSPVQWQILEGKNRITTCLIEAKEKVDSGPILFRDSIEFDGTELYAEIRQEQASSTIRLITKLLKHYPDIERQSQSGLSTSYPRRRADDSELDPDKTLAAQFDLLRVCNNTSWPAFFWHRGKKYLLKIEEA